MNEERIRRLEMRVESLRNRIDELKRSKRAQRNENAHLTLQVQRYKSMLSQPPLNEGEKKQLRLIRIELKQCKEQKNEQ